MEKTKWFLELINNNIMSLDCFLLNIWKKYEPYILSQDDDNDKKVKYQLCLEYNDQDDSLVKSNIVLFKTDKNGLRENEKILFTTSIESPESLIIQQVKELFNKTNQSNTKKNEDGTYASYFYLLLLDSLSVLHVEVKDSSEKYKNHIMPPKYNKQITIYNTTNFYDQKALSSIEKDYFGNDFKNLKTDIDSLGFQPRNLLQLSSAWKIFLLEKSLTKEKEEEKEVIKL